MIDKNKVTPPLDVARAIAKKYVANPQTPIFNEKNEITGYTPITDIKVTLGDHGVYINTEDEALQVFAAARNLTIVTVMKDGKFTKGFNPDIVDSVDPGSENSTKKTKAAKTEE